MRRLSRMLLAAVVLAAVVGVAPPPLPGPAPAAAQASCGSAAQAWEQIQASITGRILSPGWGPVGELAADGAGLVSTETPGEAFLRCWEEGTDDGGGDDGPDVDDPDLYDFGRPRRTGGGGGDPHLDTLDGLAYDFHGAGDYTLVENPSSGDEIQVRFTRSTDTRFSVVQAIAAREGDTVVTFVKGRSSGSGPVPEVTIDGEEATFDVGGWVDGPGVTVQRLGTWVFAEFDSGLAIGSGGRTIRVFVPPAYDGTAVGLLGDSDGDPTNDVARRDGSLVDPLDRDTLYGGFLDDWVVDPSESLFPLPFDVEEDGPIRPVDLVTLGDLDPVDLAAAREVCTAAGLDAGRGLEQCMYDVALTGDPEWADAAAAPLDPVVPAAAIAPRITRTTELDAATITGSIDAGEGHEIEAPAAPDGVTRILQATEPCGALLPAVAVVLVDGRVAQQRTLGCGVTLELPPIAHTIRIVSPGGPAQYGIRVVELGADGLIDAGALVLDTPLVLPAALGDQRWVFRLPDRVASEDPSPALFVTSLSLQAEAGAAAPCGAQWVLLDDAEETVDSGSLCFDVAGIDSAGAVSFAVDLPAGVGAEVLVGLVGAGADVAVGSGERERFDGDLAAPGQVDRYTLDVAAGDEILLADPVGDNDCSVVWSVEAAEGALFRGASCFDTDPIVVTTAGAVDVVVDGGTTTGPYAIEVIRVPEPRVEPLVFGEELDASIVVPGARVVFTFEGSAGDEVVLSDPSGSNVCRVVWRVLAPDGSEVFDGASCFGTEPIVLSVSGAHRVEVDGDQATVGEIALAAYRVPEPRVEPLVFGEELDASIVVPGARVVFTFEGSAGDEVMLSDPSGSNVCRVVWRVFGPDGSVVFDRASCLDAEPIVLAASGAHRLEVDGDQATVGEIALLAELR